MCWDSGSVRDLSQEYLRCVSPQTDHHGRRHSTNHQHLQGRRRPVLLRGQKPFWQLQQHWRTCCQRYFSLSGSGYCTFQSGSFKLLLRWKKKFQLKHEIENEIYDHFMFLPAWQTYKSSVLLSAVSNCSCSGVKLNAAVCSCVEGIFCHRHSIWKELLLRFQIWVLK